MNKSIYEKNKKEIIDFIVRNNSNAFLTIQFNNNRMSHQVVCKRLRQLFRTCYRYYLGRGWVRKVSAHFDFTGTIEHGVTGCATHVHLFLKTPMEVREVCSSFFNIAHLLRADAFFIVEEKSPCINGRHKTKMAFKPIFDENGLADYVLKEMKGLKDTNNIITHNMLFS